MFLPMLDRGIDAVVHRLEDASYMALQVKAKTVLHGPEAVISVYENHLFTDDQLVIGVHLEGDHLGPYALVVDAATFKRTASRDETYGRMMLVADWPTHPIPGHKWTEYLVPVEGLAKRLGSVVTKARLKAAPTLAVSDGTRLTGFVGEQEICLRLAMLEDCGLFRPFPDDETAEILIRRLVTGKTIGLQIKTCQLAEPKGRGQVHTLKSSFIAAPTTFVVVIAWVAPEHCFHQHCLVIPSQVLPSVASFDGRHYEFEFTPDSSRGTHLDRYMIPLETLAQVLAKHL